MFLSHTLSVFLLFRLFILVVKQNKTHTPLRLHDSCKYIDVKNSLVLSHKNTYILCSLRTCVYTTHWYLHMCRPEHSARILKRYIYIHSIYFYFYLYMCALSSFFRSLYFQLLFEPKTLSGIGFDFIYVTYICHRLSCFLFDFRCLFTHFFLVNACSVHTVHAACLMLLTH